MRCFTTTEEVPLGAGRGFGVLKLLGIGINIKCCSLSCYAFIEGFTWVKRWALLIGNRVDDVIDVHR